MEFQRPSLDLLARLAIIALAIASTVAGLALFLFNPAFSLPLTISVGGLAIAVAWIAAIGIAWRAALTSPRPLAIVATAFVLPRLVMAAVFLRTVHPAGTDDGAYRAIAASILSGHGIAVDGHFALFPPLYPLLLAACGGSVFLANALADAGVAFTMTRFRPGRVGLAAATAYLLWPSVVLSAMVAQKEALATFLLLQVAFAFWRQRDGFQRAEAVRLGLATGLLALAQPALATFAVCAGVMFLPSFGLRRMARLAIIAAPLAALVLVPWWIRNWLVFGAFVPLTSGSGISVLVGVTGSYSEAYAMGRLPELEWTRLALQSAARHVSADPAGAIANHVTATGQALAIEDFAVLRLQWMGFSKDLFSLWIPACQIAWSTLLWLAAVARRSEFAPLILACLLQFLAFNSLFEFAERHRYPMTPLLILVAVGPLLPARSSDSQLRGGLADDPKGARARVEFS